MGSLPSEVISKTTLELEKYNFFNGKPKIETERIDLAETKLIELKISIPIKTFFGMEFYLISTSHAT
jgi:hypothetical protein